MTPIEIKIEGFEGLIKLRPMRNLDKLDLLQNLGLDLKDIEKAKNKEKLNESLVGQSAQLKAMFKAVENHIESIDLRNDQHHFKCWDDLDYHPSAMVIQMQLVNHLFKMGK